eukprot:s699_g32.t1
MTIELTIQADSVTALAMAQRFSAASPAINFLGAVLGILLETAKVEDIRLVHIPSRPSKWKGSSRPPELGDVQISECEPRADGYYPLPPPGKRPDLWGISEGDEGHGPWFSLFK